MLSLAIYEFIGFIIALPLSYTLAYLARKYSYDTYKDEIDRLYAAIWTGEDDDELNAWLKVKQIFKDKKAPKKKEYINKKISSLNKHHFYGDVSVDKKGILNEELLHPEKDSI